MVGLEDLGIIANIRVEVPGDTAADILAQFVLHTISGDGEGANCGLL